MSTPQKFMEVSEKYLENSTSIGIFSSWQMWLILGLAILIGVGTFFWLKKEKIKKNKNIENNEEIKKEIDK